MRIFVGEYVCGGGLSNQEIQDIPLSLRQEGAAMLRAIVTDLAMIAQPVVPLDKRFADSLSFAADTVEVTSDAPLWGQWVEVAKTCDAALIVAPESDGVLAKSVAMLRAGGIDVIAGSGDFLRVASDKLMTAKTLTAAGVAHPIYMALSDKRFQNELADHERFVVKPRDGCGTQEIRTFDSFDDARAELEANLILQAWRPGRAVSVALVASSTQQAFLPAVSQNLCDSSWFVFRRPGTAR